MFACVGVEMPLGEHEGAFSKRTEDIIHTSKVPSENKNNRRFHIVLHILSTRYLCLLNKGVYHTVALPFTLKKYLRQKKN